MLINALVLSAVVIAAAILLWPRLANAPLWRATITPLASIIGSGFLVLGPVLDRSYGGYAPLAMLALCVLAYGFGAAIRYNIADIEARPRRGVLIDGAEAAASVCLAFAFIISVSYYLNLFGAFGVTLTEVDDAFHARLLTTAVFVLILVVGWSRGFTALERMEQVSVGLKLAIIAGLILGLAAYFGKQTAQGALAFEPAQVTGWAALTLLAGLLVTVQGFETSRYLGSTYDARTRIRSMRLAQAVATAIYLLYLLLLTYAFESDVADLSETAIIELMQLVAPVLPALLVLAALSAQFSAAVADTSGAGGLMGEVTRGRLTPRLSYLVLVAVGVMLTWIADVFEIISYASRAFALYYTIQNAIACAAAWQNSHRARAAAFGLAALLGLAIALLGQAVE